MARLFDRPERVAADVLRVPLRLVNAYFVGQPGGPWVVVDAGLPFSADAIRRAARQRFGARAKPEAILLTHGHADHAGSARYLAEAWQVSVYAHALELPHLTGRAPYPSYDASAPGPLGPLSRLLPTAPLDLSGCVFALPPGGAVPGLPDWEWIPTPGHTRGHVAYHRPSDGVLLAGDAVATMNLDSALCYAERPANLHRPPAPFTNDWPAAAASVGRLARLEPSVVAGGHGRAYHGRDASEQLLDLATSMSEMNGGDRSEGQKPRVGGAALGVAVGLGVAIGIGRRFGK